MPSQQTPAENSQLASTNKVEAGMQHVAQLLQSVEGMPSQRARPTDPHEQRLVNARLGVASSLFLALRSKHVLTAAHSLRVAILASSWSLARKHSPELLDCIEMVSLLHDIGKVGVPDRILLKPGKLTVEEQLLMEQYKREGVEIVSACCNTPLFLETMAHVGAWYNGQKEGYSAKGNAIPLGARMISIVDAFDAMTIDTVYRRALSRERAISELFGNAGTQFDAELVRDFHDFLTNEQSQFEVTAARRWLMDLKPAISNDMWQQAKIHHASTSASSSDKIFHDNLLNSLSDAIIFIDQSQQIVAWNKAAERLTGIPATAVISHTWLPTLISLRDERGKNISIENCPITNVLRSGNPAALRLSLRKEKSNEALPIEATILPVMSSHGTIAGVTVQLHDLSAHVSLEQRVQVLHERATRDQLTGVTNRAEFDRLFEQYINEHYANNKPCSLIISDLDYFKRVNDNYGHPAGDEALKVFAQLLKSHGRAEDVVARYGGEEFLILCADCNNAEAAKLAEKLRQELIKINLPCIGNRNMTASFGVTELQNGDDADSMLCRADRALLQAKDNGRNQVIQLGVGFSEKTSVNNGLFSSIMSWFNEGKTSYLIDQHLATSVPLDVTVEKLRGFVADHNAEIITINAQLLVLNIDGDKLPASRRSTDRGVPYVVEIHFSEHVDTSDPRYGSAGKKVTILHTTIRPKRDRDRRVGTLQVRAQQLFSSLKAYLVAKEYEPVKENSSN
jgi:diguanylate cyclase (GGDEF)-like protein/PAS domain S-box-containing protein